MQTIRSSACLAWLALTALLAAACTSLATTEAVDSGTLDHVTNGLQGSRGTGFDDFGSARFADTNGDGLPDKRVGDPAANPLSSAFYNDGSEGEVRARTENHFTTGAAPTPKDAPPAQPPKAPANKPEPMMVYQGRMQVEVAQVEEAIARYTAKVKEWGGHLSQRQDAEITVRVPAARFNEALAELRGYGRVLNESMQASDVTRQHMDLTIRLENAQKSRERLLALLQKAEKVEDMLKIEEQLHRLTEQIERMTGELRFLNDQVAMSTLTAAFQGVTAAQPGARRRTPSMFPWVNAIGIEALRRAF